MAAEEPAQEAPCTSSAAMGGAPADAYAYAAYRMFAFPQRPVPIYCVAHEYRQYGGPCRHSNFLKGVKWSPDGTCMLTSSDDGWLRLYDVPPDVGQAPPLLASPEGGGGGSGGGAAGLSTLAGLQPDSLAPALRMLEGEVIYDMAWYPRMTGADATTCCFAASSRDKPIHLWDACSGEIRCSYRGYNDVDEPTAAYSLALSPDGATLVGGYNKVMYVFNITRPGRDYKRIVTHKRKAQDASLPGIISCLAFAPGGDLLAAGSYSGYLGLYDARTYELLYVLKGNKGGLTQLLFSADGNYLFSGARQDPEVLCWDVRYTYDAVYRLQRDTAVTNQRIQFDVEPCGRHLATGGCDGTVRMYDLRDGQQVDSFRAAHDPVVGVSFHPCLDLLVTASGTRQFSIAGDEGADEPEGTSDGQAQPLHNSLVVWRLVQEDVPVAADPAEAPPTAATDGQG